MEFFSWGGCILGQAAMDFHQCWNRRTMLCYLLANIWQSIDQKSRSGLERGNQPTNQPINHPPIKPQETLRSLSRFVSLVGGLIENSSICVAEECIIWPAGAA